MNARDFARERALIERRRTTSKQRRKAMASLVRRSGAIALVVKGRMQGWLLPNGQTVCVKVRYATSEHAADGLAFTQAMAAPGQRAPIRAYHCRHCHGWHLTSRPKKNSQ